MNGNWNSNQVNGVRKFKAGTLASDISSSVTAQKIQRKGMDQGEEIKKEFC